MFIAQNYADFKLVAAAFTSGKVIFCSSTGFKIWGLASGFPVLVCMLNTQPATFTTDFPAAIQVSSMLGTEIG